MRYEVVIKDVNCYEHYRVEVRDSGCDTYQKVVLDLQRFLKLVKSQYPEYLECEVTLPLLYTNYLLKKFGGTTPVLYQNVSVLHPDNEGDGDYTFTIDLSEDDEKTGLPTIEIYPDPEEDEDDDDDDDDDDDEPEGDPEDEPEDEPEDDGEGKSWV